MNDAVQKLILAIGLCLVLGGFEMRFPAQDRQRLSGRARNLVLTGIALALGALGTSLIYMLLPPGGRPPHSRGVVVSIAVGFASALLTDVLFYWYHRAEHALQVLWAVHELHHSDEELNATTSMRSSWLEIPLQALLIGIPVGYVVGLDQAEAVVSTVVLTSWFFLAHANLRLRLGVLTPLLCGPQVHRIHHSNLPQHRDKNFAQFFPFIDIVFGTYYAPSRTEFPSTGAPELRSDAPIATIMMRPFRLWARSLRKLVST